MKVPSHRFLVTAYLALVTGMAGAATPPPTSPFEAYAWKAVSKSKPSPGLTMGSFHIQFEKTTLAMVQKAVGVGALSHQGDAGESIYWLCYTIPKPNNVERVWIISHGEMGGHEHAITNVISQEISQTKNTKDCPSLPTALQPLSFGTGLWLGMLKNEALNILGRPSHQSGAWWIFDYQSTVPGKCEPDGFLVTNWLFFENKAGRLVHINAGQVTSC